MIKMSTYHGIHGECVQVDRNKERFGNTEIHDPLETLHDPVTLRLATKPRPLMRFAVQGVPHPQKLFSCHQHIAPWIFWKSYSKGMFELCYSIAFLTSRQTIVCSVTIVANKCSS